MGHRFWVPLQYITQGRPDRGLLRLTAPAQATIIQGIGVNAAPLLQPTQITTRTAQGNPVCVPHPTAIARLPIHSDIDIIYFTHASGTQQRTPVVGCASVRITRHADGLHVEHQTGATIFGASSHGELRTLADWQPWRRRRLGCSGLGKPRLPVPGKRPEGELLAPQPPPWRGRRPSSSTRLLREDPKWRPFESLSKGTPPPG